MGFTSTKKNTETRRMDENTYYSFFILRKNTTEKAIEKVIDTFENVVLDGNQSVESTALPTGETSIEVYGKMSPTEVSRALTIINQCDSSYTELAINNGV